MINYIVATYFGKRRNKYVQDCVDADPFHLVKSHLLSIAKYSMKDVHKVTFVVNKSENEEADKSVFEVVEKYASLPLLQGKEIDVLYNEDNRHISYGAWNYGAEHAIRDPRTKYMFLLEDDYVPSGDEFYEPYLKVSREDVAYVCQLWTPSKNPKLKFVGRVAITNGLLNADICRKIYDTYGSCFYLEETADYQHIMKSKGMDDINKKYILSGVAQNYFIRYFLDCQYRIIDLGEGWSQLFLDSHGVKPYKEGEVSKIMPIHEYIPITEEDFYGK